MMFESAESASSFWMRLMELCSPAPPDLMCLICTHLSDKQQQALRCVNKAMRTAMNATVRSIRVRRTTLPSTHQQLHQTFPNLTALTLGPFERQSMFLVDFRVCLMQLAPRNAPLLAMLHRLTLFIPIAMTEPAEAFAIWDVLNR
jgi:hypothetical protein